jgi:hypothetical protein
MFATRVAAMAGMTPVMESEKTAIIPNIKYLDLALKVDPPFQILEY